MLCERPFISHGAAYGCGQCMPCRINKRRIWAHRIKLEASMYSESSFVTLTYADEHLPDADKYPGGNLSPTHLRLFMKRLRKSYEPFRFRFFAVGEYGDSSGRAHYHAVLFGVGSCVFGTSRYRMRRVNCCSVCDNLRDRWGYGLIESSQFNDAAADYIAGYVTKKMTHVDDPRLNGRVPEFSRQSNRPGIGADYMEAVAEKLRDIGYSDEDVPNSLRHGNRLLPLGRYLVRRLRRNLGREENAPQSTLDKVAEEVWNVRLAARNHPEGFRGALREATEGRRLSLLGKAKIRKVERKY